MKTEREENYSQHLSIKSRLRGEKSIVSTFVKSCKSTTCFELLTEFQSSDRLQKVLD